MGTGIACWNFHDPEFLPRRQALMNYVAKTPLFGAQSIMNYVEGVKVRTKEEIRAFLDEFGGALEISEQDGPSVVVRKICHNASLFPMMFEKHCPDKQFVNFGIDLSESPNQIMLDHSSLIDKTNYGPLVFYSA